MNAPTPLGDLLAGQVFDSLPLGSESPLVIDKPARDRLVLHDPRSAPLLRPALGPDDLRAWHHLPPTRYLVAIPRGWSSATLGKHDEAAAFAALQQRHAALAKFLAAHTETLRSQPHGDFWWELPPYPVDFFRAQAIGWPATVPLRATPLLGGAALLRGITFTTAPTTLLLAALGSRPLREQAAALPTLDADASIHLRIPALAPAAQAQAEIYAEQLASFASTRLELERSVLAHLMRDFAPPGATPGPRLAEWWRLSFEDMLQELAERFRGDVPFRFRDWWRTHLNEQRVAHQTHSATIAQLQDALDALWA